MFLLAFGSRTAQLGTHGHFLHQCYLLCVPDSLGCSMLHDSSTQEQLCIECTRETSPNLFVGFTAVPVQQPSSSNGRAATSSNSIPCSFHSSPYLFPSPRPLANTAPHHPASSRNPQQTPAVPFTLLVYAHRGGCLEKSRPVENTLPDLRVADKLGVDVLELHAQLTRDGHVVVCRDGDLGRLCGPQHAGKRVADYTLAELPQLRYDYQPMAFTDQYRSLAQTQPHQPQQQSTADLGMRSIMQSVSRAQMATQTATGTQLLNLTGTGFPYSRKC